MTRWTTILILTAIFGSTILYGQTDTTYFQDSLKFIDKKVNHKLVYRTVYSFNGQKKQEGAYKTVWVYRIPFAIDKGSASRKEKKYFNHKHLFHDNIKNGKWIYWYPNGNIQQINWLKKGRITKWSTYDQSGQIIFENKKIKRKKRIFNPSYDPQN